MLPPDLALLLARCHRREPAAQRALYARYAPTMLAVARRYAASLPEAEDVLQDAFVKVFTYLDNFRGDGSLEGWIRRIVVSTAIDAWHRHRALRQLTDRLDDTHHHLPAPESDALARLSADEVLALIELLPDGCRLVLLLYTVDGYAHAEIGELLGITESTSKAQLSKARRRLVALLHDQEKERIAFTPASPVFPPSR